MLDVKSVACHVQACSMQNPAPGAANDNRFGCPSKFSSAPHPVVRGWIEQEKVEEWRASEFCYGARTLLHKARCLIALSLSIRVAP